MGLRVKRIVLFAILFVAAFLAASVAYTLRVSLGPSSACRSPTDGPVQPGTTTARILVSGERERCYLLHIPPGYDPARSLPLVVMLHGLASNGETIQKVTGWDKVADRESLIVVYPDGLLYPLRWNANSNMKLDVDDVQFFRDLVAEISTLVSVDPGRVYVTGFSNGATMSIAIACRAADLVAAIGLVDPGILTEETLAGCSPSRPVPAMEFVGTGDVGMMSRGQLDEPHQEFTPLLGWILNIDADYEALPLRAWAEYWTASNGCDAAAEQLPTEGNTRGVRYGNCRGNAEVVVYILEGMGHQWPGGEPFPRWLVGEPNNDVAATEQMWRFFKDHSLKTAPSTDTLAPSLTTTSALPTATETPFPTATSVPPTATPRPLTPTTNPRQKAPGRFYSIVTDKYYKIYVELPRGYDPQAATVYPVVYLLDAQWYWDWLPGTDQFTGAVDLIRTLSGEGHMPPVILVGIDTSSTLDQRHNTLVTDSPRFYAFLANELIPYVDAHYRTDPTTPRTLIGHSDGCYFVLYALFQYGRVEVPPFGYFLGLSGDHSQTGGQNFIDELKLFNRIGLGGELDAALYLAWGEAEEERFTTSNPDLVELLQSREYQGFRFKSIAFEGKDHDGTVYPGIKYGLVWVFGE